MTDKNGKTALMWAAEIDNIQFIELLAPFEARMLNTNGERALMLAADCNNIRSVKYLVHFESDILVQGLTASNFANDYYICQFLKYYEDKT